MCLFPKLVRNPKYKPNKKNGGYYEPPKDSRLLRVPIGCGNCIECRQQKANEWRTRLTKEYGEWQNAYFVTLTFSEKSLQKIENELKCSECNAVAGYAVRHFLERWRKHHKKSLRHWLITELGHENTERIHLHGIIFNNEDLTNDTLTNYWKYGRTDIGEYCNLRTINYIVKYVTKIDRDHKGYKAEIFCSPGIGGAWCNTREFEARKYNGKNTIEYMSLPNGTHFNMPIYYRNKRYSEEEREALWLQKMDEQTIYVRGIKCKVDTPEHIQQYNDILQTQQELNNEMGYGNDNQEWNKKAYNTTIRKLNIAK